MSDAGGIKNAYRMYLWRKLVTNYLHKMLKLVEITGAERYLLVMSDCEYEVEIKRLKKRKIKSKVKIFHGDEVFIKENDNEMDSSR